MYAHACTYLATYSTHVIYSYIVLNIWLTYNIYTRMSLIGGM